VSAYIITNIKQLAGITDGRRLPLRRSELAQINTLDNAYLVVEGEEIAEYGIMSDLQDGRKQPSTKIDASGCIVLPAWCDSHTHLLYAGSREQEFVDKINGLSYAEIAARGGGILNSALKLAESSDEQLLSQTQDRIDAAMQLGTANFEIKSGYGLTLEQELRMLRIIKKLKQHNRATIRSTLLGAHAVPVEYRDHPDQFVDIVVQQMIPSAAAERLADYVDVFCEKGFFTNEQTEKICSAAITHGMKVRLHANQLSASGAVQLGVSLGAISVDHLETMDDDAVKRLASSETIGTMLPSAAFFLRAPFQPARKMIDAGAAVALASDCNPGSSPGYNMNFVVSLACIALRMLPAEAINAATFNGACALELQHQTGSIETGKKADLIITKPISSLSFLPYSFSTNLVQSTIIKGEIIS
jgi:imidazolonepropionase